MATRFYLPASGTAPLGSLGVRSDWELSTGLTRVPCLTYKTNTALANDGKTWGSASTQQWCWRQYQSQELLAAYDWTTSDTVSMVIGKCYETTTSGDTHLAYIVRVVSNDGSVERGVIGLYHATSTEYPLAASAATRIHSARTNGATTFSSQIGDRIIIELGLHGVTPALEAIQMRFGDPSGTADFALTAALTTDLCPWVELSRTVSVGYRDATAESATATDAQDATITHAATEAESGTGVDTPSAIMTALASGSESGTGTDTPSSVIITSASETESSSAADTPDAGLLLTSATEESSPSVDTQDRVITTAAALADSSTATDEQSTTMIGVVVIAETSSSTDSNSASSILESAITESASAGDVSSTIATLLASISEATSSQDLQDSTAIFVVMVSEAGSGSDLQSNIATLLSEITESGSAADITDYVAGNIIEAVLAEGATAENLQDALRTIIGIIEENASAVDVHNGSLPATIAAAINEALYALDGALTFSVSQTIISVNSQMYNELVLQSRMD